MSAQENTCSSCVCRNAVTTCHCQIYANIVQDQFVQVDKKKKVISFTFLAYHFCRSQVQLHFNLCDTHLPERRIQKTYNALLSTFCCCHSIFLVHLFLFFFTFGLFCVFPTHWHCPIVLCCVYVCMLNKMLNEIVINIQVLFMFFPSHFFFPFRCLHSTNQKRKTTNVLYVSQLLPISNISS